MFYLRYILIFSFVSILLSANLSESSLVLKTIDQNRIELSFEYYPDNIILKNSYTSMNALGFPTFIYTIAIPNDVDYDISYDLFNNQILDPIEDSKPLFMDGLSSNEKNTYKENLVYVSQEIIKENKKYLILSICPYKKNQTQTMLYENIDIHITTNRSIGLDSLQILSTENSSEIFLRSEGNNQWPSLLIIAPDGDNIQTLMTPLMNWKKMKGYKVFYHTLSETGYSNTEIKSFIQNAYDNWEYPPNFICIVGDADGPYTVPTFIESVSLYNGEGDHPYTLLEGDDNISDVSIGRLSIRSLSHLANITNKILHYEQEPFLNNEDWFKRALCVGDPSISGISTIITNQIIAELMLNNDYDEVLEVYEYPFVPEIENGINDGVSFYNYRGFAGSSGWQKDDANNLENGYMLPVVSVITCDTGSFLEDEESTAENFLRTGSISIPRGGIAAIGMATQGTHTMFNNCLDYGIYHAIFVENVKTLGEALRYAKNNLWLNYPDNPNNYVDIFSHWINLMGDPTLSVWTDIPQVLDINVEPSLPYGQNYLDVQITSNDELIDNVTITITDQNYNLISKGLTDENGFVRLTFDLENIEIGEYHLTSSKNNYIPLFSNLNVEEVSISMNIDDLNITNQISSFDIYPGDNIIFDFNIYNYGLSELNDLSGEIIFNDPDISIDNNSFVVENSISSNQLSTPIEIEGSINSSVFHKEVVGEIITYYQDMEFHFPISFVINGPNLNIIDFNTDNGDSFLIPDSYHGVNFTLENTGALSDPIQMIVSENSPHIELENDVLNIPSIDANEMLFLDETIGIQVLQSAYPGLQIPISISFETIAGEVLYNQTYTFNVGQISNHDPLGPDLYGYYIYDNFDIAYNDVPIYDWIEIDPYFSGSGTILINLDDNGENQDDVTLVNMPFDFQFYGQTYNQISISTNGWIKPGVTNQSGFRNWRLPGAGGASPMIAAFWDDLQTQNGRICVKYDDDNHWYIVEWSNIENAFDGLEETFQIIIYDESYYPTLTDDNIIKLQYKVFNNTNSGHYEIYNQWHGNYASIGIENNEADIGLEYTWNNEYCNACSELTNESALLITTNSPEYLYPPLMNVSALENYSYELYDNQVVSESFFIQNDGEANLYINIEKDCNEPAGLSEPDEHGNAWISSESENGPEFMYTDITDNGTVISFINNDTAVENIPIGFDFPFYGNSYSELLISPNGWIGFGNDNYNYVNVPLPSELAPTNAIMALWDDLNPNNQSNNSGSGDVYYLSNTEFFIVSFENVSHYQVDDTDFGVYSFQIILYPSGEIEIVYDNIEGLNNSATVGIQNEDASQFLQINFNTPINNQTAIEVRQLDNWLTYSIDSYIIPGGSQQELTMTIDANQTESDANECELIIESNAENIQNIIIPVSLNINTDSPLLGDLNFDNDINVLDIVTMIQLIIYGPIDQESLSTGDINLDDQLNVLDVVLLVNFILEE